MKLTRQNRRFWPCVIASLGMTLSAPAMIVHADHHEKNKTEHTRSESKDRASLNHANRLIGAEVYNRENQELGSIEDIVLDQGQNRASYAVLSFGGVLGFGDKLFAVPWSSLTISDHDDETRVEMDISKSRLENAPGFDQDHWPDMGDARWARDVDQFHRDRDQNRDRDETNSRYNQSDEHRFWVRRLSKVIGSDVKNRDAENLGEVEDVIVDVHSGTLAYAIVSTGGMLDLRGKQVAVPWDALVPRPLLGTFLVDADEKTLETLAFDDDKYPNLSDRTYAKHVHEEFDSKPYWDITQYFSSDKDADPNAAWKADSEYNRQYDADQAINVSGTVASVGTFRPQSGAVDGLRLKIKSQRGETWIVQVGPESYVREKGVRFHYGDRVKVTGVTIDTWRGDVLIAGEITVEDETIELRDKEGKPRWNVDQLSRTSASAADTDTDK